MRASALLACICLFFGLPAAAADAYPSRVVTIIVPYAPGGATDIVARVIAEELRQTFGQTFVVENKPGAFGILAIQELAKAPPDGSTLMIGNVSTNVLTPILFAKRMSFDYARTVMPVMTLAEVPNFLLENVALPPRSIAELVAYAKARPGQIRFGSAGIGSYPHFDMERFNRKAGLDMLHIPAKNGASDMLNAMLAGDVQLGFLNVATAAGMIKSGRLYPLATTADARLADWPDVPTMAEAGFAGIGTNQWQALFVRAGTPKEIVDTLFAAVTKALRSERASRVFAPANVAVTPSASPDEAVAWLQGEMEKWRNIVAAANVRID